MKKFLLSILLTLYAANAFAACPAGIPSSNCNGYSNFLNNTSPANLPSSSSDRMAITQGGQTNYLPAQFIINGPTVPDTNTLRNSCTSSSSCPSGDYIYFNGITRLSFSNTIFAPPLYFSIGTGLCSTDDGASCVNSADGNHWNGVFYANVADIREFGTIGNGSNDDTSSFINGVTWCGAGGTLDRRVLAIGGGRFVVNATPNILASCTVAGPTGFTPMEPQNNPSSITLPSAILLGTGQTILVTSGGLENLRIVPASLTPATSFQDSINKVNAFSGTGITFNNADDANINHVLIVGFNQCIGSTGTHNAREIIDHVWIDCTNGIDVDNAHDVDEISFIRGWQFFNGNNGGAGGNPYSFPQFTITGLANNGSGLIRLTLNTTAQLATGNHLVINSIAGALGANGYWAINLIDANNIDLQGSNFTSYTYSGTETAGQGLITGFTNLLGINPGEIVTGTGIPTNTTVLAVDKINGNIWISNLALSTGAESLSFATGTFTGAASTALAVDAVHRSGIFIKSTTSEENHFTDLFEFGWHVGYNPSTGTQWQIFHNVGCDGNQTGTDVCIRVDGSANRAQFIGANITGGPYAIDDASSAQGTLYRGIYIENTSIIPTITVYLENNSQTVDLDGRGNGALNYVADYDQSGTLRFSGLFTNTHLLDSVLPVINSTITPTPVLVGTRNWTPTLLFNNANVGQTCTVCSGNYYISTEGLMIINFKIDLSALGSSAGFADVGNLPTPCINNNTQSVGTIGYYTNLNTAITYPLSLVVNGGTYDELDIRGTGTGNTPQLTNSSFTNTSEFFGTLTCPSR